MHNVGNNICISKSPTLSLRTPILRLAAIRLAAHRKYTVRQIRHKTPVAPLCEWHTLRAKRLNSMQQRTCRLEKAVFAFPTVGVCRERCLYFNKRQNDERTPSAATPITRCRTSWKKTSMQSYRQVGLCMVLLNIH